MKYGLAERVATYADRITALMQERDTLHHRRLQIAYALDKHRAVIRRRHQKEGTKPPPHIVGTPEIDALIAERRELQASIRVVTQKLQTLRTGLRRTKEAAGLGDAPIMPPHDTVSSQDRQETRSQPGHDVEGLDAFFDEIESNLEK